MEKKLYRNEYDKTIAGVCSGLAEYLKLDVNLVRVAFLLLAIFKGGGVLAYIILWVVLPVKHTRDADVDYIVGESGPAQPTYVSPQPHNGAAIAGFILIGLGAYFLLDDLDFMPNWFNAHTFWPMVIIAIGLAIIFGSRKKEIPWQNKQTWDKRQPEDPLTGEVKKEEDNPPAV